MATVIFPFVFYYEHVSLMCELEAFTLHGCCLLSVHIVAKSIKYLNSFWFAAD